ncbi:hypothetical protein BGAL_0018g00460 [Botrytis galanthina]|uniref:Uncharacterized protein n=1 Tax=Botrytis galanthina TaxID=278940 RepID=A0A4S8RAW2_9HELO|nr:hypothetical protein BGAL_0018g00460 [Botrytis galanthina]
MWCHTFIDIHSSPPFRHQTVVYRSGLAFDDYRKKQVNLFKGAKTSGKWLLLGSFTCFARESLVVQPCRENADSGEAGTLGANAKIDLSSMLELCLNLLKSPKVTSQQWLPKNGSNMTIKTIPVGQGPVMKLADGSLQAVIEKGRPRTITNTGIKATELRKNLAVLREEFVQVASKRLDEIG